MIHVDNCWLTNKTPAEYPAGKLRGIQHQVLTSHIQDKAFNDYPKPSLTSEFSIGPSDKKHKTPLKYILDKQIPFHTGR